MTVAPGTSVAVVTTGLTKIYEPLPAWMKVLTRTPSKRRITALEGIDLEVASGSICAVVGPNGAGKSTLFRILMGLASPTSGSAHVLGLDCSAAADQRRMSIGFMPADERTLLLRLSCRDNLIFQGQLRGYSGARLDARVAEVLELVGLAEAADRAAFALSSGMRARLQLGRALVHDPDVLILDEPTSTVDPVAAYDLLGLIQQLTKERDLAVLLSSHRLEEIDALDEVVLLLDRGKVVFNGDLTELRRLAVITEVTMEFDDDGAAERAAFRLVDAPLVESARRRGRQVEVVTAQSLGGLLALVGPLCAHIAHVDEHSGSTRSLLQRVYRADGAPVGTS